MGQFKPMVKMMTTEPSIELKLKKGGKVEKKMQMGGALDMAAPAAAPAMPARGGMMGARAPMKPSMAARRRAMRAMPAGAAPAAPVGMAAQMMKEGGESKAEHKAEMAKMAKTAKALKEHADKPASKAHKGLKTGGVVMGQGGYKAGGIINTENQGGAYRNTKMHDGGKEDVTPKKTGEVKMGKPGGYATGGVAKANAGGYKHGGAAKKAYATGGSVNKSGAPVAMPQGRKTPTPSVSITELSGTFKKGGKVTAAQGRLMKNFDKENATAMKQAKAYSNEVYSKYGKKMAGGGSTSGQGGVTEAERRVLRTAQEGSMSGQGGVTESERRMLENIAADARNQKGYENYERLQREENEAMRNAILGAPKRMMRGIKGLFSPKAPQGSVTEAERSITVTPAKKRGGAVC
jgi:hypothetical protein